MPVASVETGLFFPKGMIEKTSIAKILCSVAYRQQVILPLNLTRDFGSQRLIQRMFL